MKDKIEEAKKILQEQEQKDLDGFIQRFNDFLKKEGRTISVQNNIVFPKNS